MGYLYWGVLVAKYTEKQIHQAAMQLSPAYWAKAISLKVGGGAFDLLDHPYQVDVIDSPSRVKVRKWSTQVGKTLTRIIPESHALIYKKYPQGAGFIFPNDDLVDRFSKGRFKTLVDDNPLFAKYITSTDTSSLKRINGSNLYFLGAKVKQKIQGEVKSSASLKEAPMDSLNFDEVDEIDPAMIDLAMDRVNHSTIKNISYTGSPTIPDFGIDKLFQESDQKVWMIRCEHCGGWTCLELEFPECVTEDGLRLCSQCRKTILPNNKGSQWVAQKPGHEIDGTWISKLCLADKYVNVGDVLKKFQNPPNGNLGAVYNGDLGIAYISAENRLTPNDLWAIQGMYPMISSHSGPCAMGVDVGNDFHYVIKDRPYENTVRTVKVGHVSSEKMTDFSPLYDIAKRFNVKCMVIDYAPVQNKVKAFQAKANGFEVYGCIYQEKKMGVVNWDSKAGIVRVNRTEICDTTVDGVQQVGRSMLPRKCSDMDEYIRQMCNIAKVIEEDQETGSKEFRYRKLGPDHYFHADNYANLACQRVALYVPKKEKTGGRDGYDDNDSHSTSKNWMAA